MHIVKRSASSGQLVLACGCGVLGTTPTERTVLSPRPPPQVLLEGRIPQPLRSWQIPTRLQVSRRPSFKELELSSFHTPHPKPHPSVAHSTVTGMLPGWISVTSGTWGPERLHPGLRQRGQSRVKIRAPGAQSCKCSRCARSVHLAHRPLRLHGALPASPLLHCGSGSPASAPDFQT